MSVVVQDLILFVIFGAVAALLAGFGWLYLKASSTARLNAEKLNAEGIPTVAEVLSKRTGFYRRGGVAYFITCRFTANAPDGTARPVTFEEQIYDSEYRNLNAGDHIRIRYLTSDPTVKIIDSGARQVFTANSFRVGGIAMMVIAGFTVIFGIVMAGLLTNSELRTQGTATAYYLRLSATPNSVEMTATSQQATAVMNADLGAVETIRQVLGTRITEWQKVTDKVMHTVSPLPADLKFLAFEIDYGYCERGHFYLYVWQRITDRIKIGTELDSYFDGYGYVQESQPPDCYPKELSQVWLRNSGKLGGGWFAVSGATEQKPPSGKE